MSNLLYADDTVLFASSENELKLLVKHFEEVCRRRLIKANGSKSKIIVIERNGNTGCNISINGENMEVVNEFKYLGCMIGKRGTCEAEVTSRIKAGRQVAGAMMKICKKFFSSSNSYACM